MPKFLSDYLDMPKEHVEDSKLEEILKDDEIARLMVKCAMA
jgi:hypothetical protein